MMVTQTATGRRTPLRRGSSGCEGIRSEHDKRRKCSEEERYRASIIKGENAA
jgi:hypothetical protein